jgi:hypothetical protein
MKLCPTCNRSYQDENLNFCLEDETPLVIQPNSEVQTRIFTSSSAPTLSLSTSTHGDRPATRYAKSNNINIAYLGEWQPSPAVNKRRMPGENHAANDDSGLALCNIWAALKRDSRQTGSANDIYANAGVTLRRAGAQVYSEGISEQARPYD